MWLPGDAKRHLIVLGYVPHRAAAAKRKAVACSGPGTSFATSTLASVTPPSAAMAPTFAAASEFAEELRRAELASVVGASASGGPPITVVRALTPR